MNDLQMIQNLLAGPAPSSEAVAAGRERLRSSYHRRSFQLPRPTWPVMAGMGLTATAAVAAVAVGVSGTTPRAPDPGHTTQIQLSAASQTLETAARTVEGRPDVEPGPHQWLHITYVDYQAGKATTTDHEWITFDGIQTAYNQGGKLVSHTSPRTTVSDASPMGAYNILSKLPADPQTLLPNLYRMSAGQAPPIGTDRDSQAWANIVQLLWNSPVAAPPKLQAAIFRALTKIPGMRVEQVHDILGRPALGLYRSGSGHDDLLLDPHTYQVIGRLNISSGPSKADEQMAKQKKKIFYPAPAGTITWSVVRTTTTVDGPGQS